MVGFFQSEMRGIWVRIASKYGHYVFLHIPRLDRSLPLSHDGEGYTRTAAVEETIQILGLLVLP